MRQAATTTSVVPSAPSTQPPCALTLIHGGDDFSVKERAKALYETWCAELGGMDHEWIDANVTHSGEALTAIRRLREALQTLPLFGSAKVVWFKNCNFLGEERAASTQAVLEALASMAAELKSFVWKDVRLLISAGKMDERRTFFKTLKSLGSVETFEAWSLEDREWTDKAEQAANQAISGRKKTISEDALANLVAAVGPHARQLMQEVEKVLLFAGDRPRVEVSDVEAVVTRNKQARAFALAEALGDRDLSKLLRALDDEFWEMKVQRSKTAIGLLYGLINKVRILILVQELLREKWIRPETMYPRFKTQLAQLSPENLSLHGPFNPLAMHPFQLFKALPQSRRYTMTELIQAMEKLLECNQRLIYSDLDERLILQQVLVSIVGRDRGRVPIESTALA